MKHHRGFHSVHCCTAQRHQDSISAALLNVTKKSNCRKSSNEHAAEANPVRPSCLECVEKHLGAASVIASEVYEGYAYRLRLLGHLHEAQEEPQQWSTLHDTIRRARKDYQRHGTVPDWELFAQMINEVRDVR